MDFVVVFIKSSGFWAEKRGTAWKEERERQQERKIEKKGLEIREEKSIYFWPKRSWQITLCNGCRMQFAQNSNTLQSSPGVCRLYHFRSDLLHFIGRISSDYRNRSPFFSMPLKLFVSRMLSSSNLLSTPNVSRFCSPKPQRQHTKS